MKMELGLIKIASLIVTLALVILGVSYFASEWQYSEDGHGKILLIYIALCIALGIFSSFKKWVLVFTVILLSLSTLIYANEKFEWRKEYVQSFDHGRGFELQAYADRYPTYEDYMFQMFNDTPKWVDFNKECYVPLINKQEPEKNCQSSGLISTHYNIDVYQVIDGYYNKMRYTARQIQSGAFPNKAVFQKCLNEQRCVPIPLLPNTANKVINEASEDYIDIRRQFWSLIEDDKISPENCNYFEFCRIMNAEGIIAVE